MGTHPIFESDFDCLTVKMSDMDYDSEEYDIEYSCDSDSEPDVNLENQYYNAKSLKGDNYDGALAGFAHVLEIEGEEKGVWGFKALKQQTKINFYLSRYDAMLESYRQLLTYIKSAVTRNYSEKSINSILDYISNAKQMDLLQNFYELTLESLKHAKNERLWFKTNTKLASLYLQSHDWAKLQFVLKQLRQSCLTESGEEDGKKGTQLLEIIQIDIQMSTIRKDNKKLKQLYEKSKKINSAIPHPLTKGIIYECGGKMHLSEENFQLAHTDFFEAFKCFDEAGSPRRISSLKYLVLSNMLSKSDINPFDSQEAKPYMNDPEIIAMTRLREAYQYNNIDEFQRILRDRQLRTTIMNDTFIKENIDSLLKLIRTQVLVKLIKPYTRVKLASLAGELNIEYDEVESLLITCILDNQIQGKIDQKTGLLILTPTENEERYESMAKWARELGKLQLRLETKVL